MSDPIIDFEMGLKGDEKNSNLAFLHSYNESGLSSKRKIAEKHEISTVNLWRNFKESRWEYGKRRDQVMEAFLESSVFIMMIMRADDFEELVLF